jgi:metal-sulfur cluster biosynthetic enzyme
VRFPAVSPRALATTLLVGLGVLITLAPRIIRSPRGRLHLNPFEPATGSGSIPADSLPLDSGRVMLALDSVQDPELELSLVELGLVQSVKVDSACNVSVVLALTTPECPYGPQLAHQAMTAIRDIPGAGVIRVRPDAGIPWGPERLSGRARVRYDSLFGSHARPRR